MIGSKSLTKKEPTVCPHCKIEIKDAEKLIKKIEYACRIMPENILYRKNTFTLLYYNNIEFQLT